jgi:DNA-binding phage protein
VNQIHGNEVMNMTDTKALKDAIENSGIPISFLARKLGITRESFYNKLKNETEFKASEIATLSNLLRLSYDQTNHIFLLGLVN